MPFPMIHLLVAKEIIKKTDLISNEADFLMGSISPDCIHYRDNYHSDMKFRSHLCVGNQKWGHVTNNESWVKNVVDFLKANKNSDHIDFLLGYCVHILTDIENNIRVWRPFVDANIEKIKMGDSTYHKESAIIDKELYLLNKDFDMMTYISNSKAYDVLDIAKKSEILALKDNFINHRYKNIEPVDTSLHKYVTVDNMTRFINEVSQDLIMILLEDFK